MVTFDNAEGFLNVEHIQALVHDGLGTTYNLHSYGFDGDTHTFTFQRTSERSDGGFIYYKVGQDEKIHRTYEWYKTTYTEKEMAFLRAIPYDYFAVEAYHFDHRDERSFATWTDVFSDCVEERTKMNKRTISGVFSSLARKGVIYTGDETTEFVYSKLPYEIKRAIEKEKNL